MIAGDPHTALVAPRSIVITEKIAKKYFGAAVPALGRSLIVNDSLNYKVTGVIRDLPTQSHFNYDLFLPMAELEESRAPNQWLGSDYNTYLLLHEGADPRKLEAKLGGMVLKYVAPLIKYVVNMSMDDFTKGGGFVRFSMTPLTAIHLHSNKTAELASNGSIQYVYIFSAIAAFILMIACVNFMNLSTARSSNRAKEVGVRKVLGSLRLQLIVQFIMESTVISLISMMLALLIAWALLPFFNQLAGKQMTIGLFSRPWLAPCLLGLVVLVGFIAGSYPAFFLSAFRPIAVLKGGRSTGFRSGWLRNSLVVFQFGISIFLIVGTVVIYRQLGYIQNKELGFNREHVLVVQNAYPLGDRAKAFANELSSLHGVEGITSTGFLPTSNWRSDDAYFLGPTLDPKTAVSLQNWPIDEQYIPVLGMKIVAGRNFSKDFPSDSTGLVINETAARMMGYADVINKNLYGLEDVKTRKVKIWHIVGVVKDFNFNSLREVVTPLGFKLEKDMGKMAVRINTSDIAGLIGHIEDKWKAMAPAQPFSYSFMDDDFNAIYRAEQRTGKISLSFSLLAIFIACLGLFGLTAYAAEQRTKEIGIRKVLGATLTNIIGLLSADFLKLVMVAALITFPFAWWAMHNWLQDFAYRIGISWTVFALAAVLAGGIALLTVSFQAFKAALANPVRSLRSE
jgi:putative ABC transport system permease protein